MTNNRFWKIVDKYEQHKTDTNGTVCFITDDGAAICNLVYYDKGNASLVLADAKLLYKGEVSDLVKQLITKHVLEYGNIGAKEFKKLHKEALTEI